jgi:hypothetical protein
MRAVRDRATLRERFVSFGGGVGDQLFAEGARIEIDNTNDGRGRRDAKG